MKDILLVVIAYKEKAISSPFEGVLWLEQDGFSFAFSVTAEHGAILTVSVKGSHVTLQLFPGWGVNVISSGRTQGQS